MIHDTDVTARYQAEEIAGSPTVPALRQMEPARRASRERESENSLEPLESLFEDAFDDLLLHSSWPSIPHHVGSAPGVHQS